jgi:NAD(P)-dependent dehydrogenase (short-subunit alcohol dehydrogenase family)
MSPFELTNKTVLITGASSGLGRQTAIRASEHGARVIITGRNAERLDETFRSLSGEGHSQIVADLTVQEEIDRLVAELPLIQGLVHSTGISDMTPVGYITRDTINRTFRISFDAIVLLTSAILRKKKLEKNNSSIVFISSISTRYPFTGGAMYISAKAAIEGYSRVLAKELAPRRTRVNCIAPALVRTPMMDETAENYSQDVIRQIEERQLLGLGEPDDVANSIIFFLSDASKWISAGHLILGGG